MPDFLRDNSGRFAARPSQPQEGEQTGDQRYGHGSPGDHKYGSYENGLLWGNGGSIANPMGFPGYGYAYSGTYSTYRWILQHPIVRLVRSIAVADILCNKWEYKGERDDEVKLIQKNFDELRSQLLSDFFVRGRDYGWAPGEPIWEMRGTETWLASVKPLIVDETDCLRDAWGNFSGLLNRIPLGLPPNNDSRDNTGTLPPYAPEVRIAAPYKAWKYTHDSEAGYLYGRSWLENIRATAWRDWLDCAQQLQKLGAKITGIQLILTVPAGTFPGKLDAAGKPTPVSYMETAAKIIKDMANGAPGAVLPALNLGLDGKVNKLDTAKIIAELASKSVINANLLNHGTNTPAIEGLLSRMRHAEENMFAGGLRSPRTGMSSQHGGMADAEQHTSTGDKIAEVEDQDFAKQLQPLVDAKLVLNKGIARKGMVRIVPPSIADNKRAYFKALMLAAMNDPEIAAEVLGNVIDVNKELDYIEVTRKGEYNAERVAKAKEKAQPKGMNTNKQPEPQGGRPTKKSGGNPKARPQKRQAA